MRPRDWVAKYLKGVQWLSNGECLAFCPLHKNTTTPALNVNYRKGVFICRGCGEHGTLFTLADKIGHPLVPTVELSDVMANAAALRSRMEQDEVRDALAPKSNRWLKQFTRHNHPYWSDTRMIPRHVQKEWDLGYDRARDAVTIPLRTLDGQVVGVIRRSLDPEAIHRWRYPIGFKNKLHLFAGDKVAQHGHYDLVLVEGSIDCIRVWMAGFPCVALLGSSFSSHQQTLIHKVAPGAQRIHVFMDNDDPGRQVQQAVENRLLADGYEVFTVPYPRTTQRNPEVIKDPGAMTLGQLQRSMGRSESVRKLRAKRVSRML